MRYNIQGGIHYGGIRLCPPYKIHGGMNCKFWQEGLCPGGDFVLHSLQPYLFNSSVTSADPCSASPSQQYDSTPLYPIYSFSAHQR